ncbi:ABC transporter G family member 22-like [Hevea brasiliensis]|uniref:ABC transporter G family member 22-like n=1 Tax=Hevea brasiliensis TaxID=3981 RepID=UPI000B778DEF|nr:ABC transporter G family member 22-like [Hevea brasiliensis]
MAMQQVECKEIFLIPVGTNEAYEGGKDSEQDNGSEIAVDAVVVGFGGQVLALMGSSGNGKTALLNLLGGRLIQLSVGFVSQDNAFFPHLTVKETLTYADLLRLPKTLTKEQKGKQAINVPRHYDRNLIRPWHVKWGKEKCELAMRL